MKTGTVSFEELRFLRELHFIEAPPHQQTPCAAPSLQFFRELHFIEAGRPCASSSPVTLLV